MKKIIYLALFFFIFVACKKAYLEDPTIPDCIKSKIKIIDDGDEYNFYGEIGEEKYTNITIYYFEPDNKIVFDGQTFVLNSKCDTVGYSGGITGAMLDTTGYGKKLSSRVIWKKK